MAALLGRLLRSSGRRARESHQRCALGGVQAEAAACLREIARRGVQRVETSLLLGHGLAHARFASGGERRERELRALEGGGSGEAVTACAARDLAVASEAQGRLRFV